MAKVPGSCSQSGCHQPATDGMKTCKRCRDRHRIAALRTMLAPVECPRCRKPQRRRGAQLCDECAHAEIAELETTVSTPVDADGRKYERNKAGKLRPVGKGKF